MPLEHKPILGRYQERDIFSHAITFIIFPGPLVILKLADLLPYLLTQAFCRVFGFAGKLWILTFLCISGTYTYGERCPKK